MPAQIGSGVVLVYGPQGTQQLGNAVLLDAVVVTGTRLVASTRAPWGGAAVRESAVRAVHDPAISADVQVAATWYVGDALDEADRAQWAIAAANDRQARALWVPYTSVADHESAARWSVSVARDDAAHAPWGRYERLLQPENVSVWALSSPVDLREAARWGGPMLTADLLHDVAFAPSVRRDMLQWVPWVKFSRTLITGIGISIPPDDGVPEALIVVPVRSVYMQVNSVSLRKVVGNVTLPAINMSLSLDMASWVWSFSASLPADAMTHIEPVAGEPVELEAFVNGETFRVIVERISRERSFASSTISVSGRGKLAALDAPYAPILTFGNTAARTVQQLMDDVLTDNGVPLGWTVNFGLTDWLVPAGVFSHRGTYIDALNRIAAAGGGYIQPHPSLNQLSVLRKYPVAPWDWATLVDPDYELPSAPVSREGIEWQDRPLYNRVFVSGVQSGILGQVTRAGTAGDLVAPMVTDALITHADAARQRGLPVLAETGRMAYVSLRLPVLDATGVIVPGKFVRYVDGATTRIGIVRSVNVDVGLPQVWQTIKLETHV